MICEHHQPKEDCEYCDQEQEDFNFHSFFDEDDSPTMYGYDGDGH